MKSWEATLLDGLALDASRQHELGETFTRDQLWAELDEQDEPREG